jgi:hypothetical protein
LPHRFLALLHFCLPSSLLAARLLSALSVFCLTGCFGTPFCLCASGLLDSTCFRHATLFLRSALLLGSTCCGLTPRFLCPACLFSCTFRLDPFRFRRLPRCFRRFCPALLFRESGYFCQPSRLRLPFRLDPPGLFLSTRGFSPARFFGLPLRF